MTTAKLCFIVCIRKTVLGYRHGGTCVFTYTESCLLRERQTDVKMQKKGYSKNDKEIEGCYILFTYICSKIYNKNRCSHPEGQITWYLYGDLLSNLTVFWRLRTYSCLLYSDLLSFFLNVLIINTHTHIYKQETPLFRHRHPKTIVKTAIDRLV